MEELYKNELQQLKDFAEREQYVSLSKILEVFQNPNEELLDDIIKYLENEGIEIHELTKQYFLAENRKKAEAFRKGEITAEGYRKWLDEMFDKKIIPEAKFYNFEGSAPIETEDE